MVPSSKEVRKGGSRAAPGSVFAQLWACLIMNEVKVDIFNKTYILRGEKTPTELRRIAREVDFRMKEMTEIADNLDLTRTAVLAALSLAEEYLELQERYDRVVQILEEEYRKTTTEQDTASDQDPIIHINKDKAQDDSSVEGEF